MSDLPRNSIVLRDRRRVFDNSRFTVYSDRITDGTLEVGDFLVVAPHSRRADLLTGVVVVPVRDDSILLLKNYRHAVGQHVWELPRGFLEDGEDPAIAALRELEEETGLVCSPEMLIDLGSFYPEPGILRARVALFAAIACKPDGAIRNDEMGIDARSWYSRAHVREMLRDGRIDEGSSSLALYRYYARLENGKTL
jgi:ADP-ribose pyrophosphatase YjhB (NUDIX family)